MEMGRNGNVLYVFCLIRSGTVVKPNWDVCVFLGGVPVPVCRLM